MIDRSNDDRSNDDRSNDDRSNDDRSNDDRANDDRSNDDRLNDDRSNDDRSNNDRSDDDRTIDRSIDRRRAHLVDVGAVLVHEHDRAEPEKDCSPVDRLPPAPRDGDYADAARSGE